MTAAPDTEIAPKPTRRFHPLRLIVSATICLALAVVLALFMRGSLRAMEVESGSMQPTLQKDDLLLAWYVPKKEYKRGEIVIIGSPDDQGADLVKRVVGIPGDEVEFRSGEFLVNGAPSPPPTGPDRGHRHTPDFRHTLGPLEYYVLGDNRPNSHDSEEFGPISKSLIHGRVLYRYGPASRIGPVH